MSQHDHDCNDDCDHEVEDDGCEEMPEPTDAEVFGPQVPTEPIFLQAGPVSLEFDPDWGILRRFKVGGQEVLRAIYPAVRSAKWRTAPPRLSELRVEASDDSFRMTFRCEHVADALGVDFSWRGTVTGTPDGTVSYGFDGEARGTMQTNRTGLCVLHPILRTAGQPVVVTHGNGSEEQTIFPALISPHQPFFDVAALTHEVAPGVRARVEFEGETFETEDQRNWTDASFKTYGGPLATPLPLVFAAGHTVRQKVTFVLLAESPPASPAPADQPVRVILPTSGTIPLPSVGARFAPEAGEPDPSRTAICRRLGLGHLLVDVDLRADDWRHRLRDGRAWAQALEVPVLLRVVFTANHQPGMAEIAEAFADSPGQLLAVSVVCPVEACPGAITLALVAAALARVGLYAPVAAAPADNFADMNRFRPAPAYWVAPPMCPQVHMFDHESIMETLEAQSSLLATVRSFNPHPLLLGPVALLRQRVHDPRQASLFAAAWTAGSLASVLPSGLAAAVTYHEHDGPMGIPGTPCAGVIEGLVDAVRTGTTTVSAPAQVAALTVFTRDGARRVLLANLTRWAVEIVCGDEDDSVFEFGPYATAWLEV